MNESKIPVRYAKSLFLLAIEKNILDAIKNDMLFVTELCNTVNDFILLVESPIVKPSKKQSIFFEMFNTRVHQYTLSFFELIIKNKRESFIKDISRDFLDLYKDYVGIKTATFTTAYKLDEASKNEIVTIIKKAFNTNIELVENVNTDIIGGFVLRVEDQQIDASVASKLNKIKHELINSVVN